MVLKKMVFMRAEFSFDSDNWLIDENVKDYSSGNYEAFNSSLLDSEKIQNLER